MSTAGVIVLVAVLVVATVVGLAMRARAGRVRTTTPGAESGWTLARVEPAPEDRVLLLQLSSPICTPCRQTAAALTELATAQPGIRHTELDVAEDPDAAAALHVMRTPTTIAFARDGRELLRVSGVPRRADLLEALDTELTGTR